MLGIPGPCEKALASSGEVSGDAEKLMGNSEHFGTPLYAAIKAHQNELALSILSWMKRADRKDLRDFLQGVRSGSTGGYFKLGPIIAAIDGDQPESLSILFEAGIGLAIQGDEWDDDFYRMLVLQSNKALRYLVLETNMVFRDPPNLNY
ncbi:hypothetical protein PG984_006227 [Apiospora sp. TS-2023a]